MSRKTIRVPRAAMIAAENMALTPTHTVAATIVGLAIVSVVFGVASLAIAVLGAAGILSARWTWAPVCSSLGLAIVSVGVAFDTIRCLKK